MRGYFTVLAKGIDISLRRVEHLFSWFYFHILTGKRSTPFACNDHTVTFGYCMQILTLKIRESSEKHFKAYFYRVEVFHGLARSVAQLGETGSIIFTRTFN